MSTTTVPDVLVVDRGSVRNAALILATQSTLAGHVVVADGPSVTRLEMNTEIPYDYWGSGTQALWRLLSAIAYSRHEVSLYEVATRCDLHNRAVVGRALAALFGGTS